MRTAPANGKTVRTGTLETGGRHDDLIRAVTDPTLMRDVLQRRLEPLAGRRWEITECHVGRLRRREGYRYAVHYDVRLRDPTTGITREQVVTGVSYGRGQTRQIWEDLQRTASQRIVSADPPPFAPYAYAPALDMLLQVFPHDHRLPALNLLMAAPPPQLAPRLLSQFGSEGWLVEQWNAESIRYRVNERATMRLNLRARHTATRRVEERPFYAKVYWDTAEARQAYEVLRLLRETVETTRARVSVAAPVAFVEELHTAVQAAVPGTPLLRTLRRKEDAIPAVRQAATAVAALHHLDLELGHLAADPPPRSLPDRIARLEQAGAVLCAQRPDLAQAVTDTVMAVVTGLMDGPRAPTHGDLKPDHVLNAGDDVSLIDFDFLRASDPILDVATMVAHLARFAQGAAATWDRPGSLAQVFSDEYFAHAPGDWRGRLPLYHAMAAIIDAARVQRGQDRSERKHVANAIRQAQGLVKAA